MSDRATEEIERLRKEVERVRNALRVLEAAGANALNELPMDGICDARGVMLAALAKAKEVLG